jgi:hypothetical protein
MDFSVEQKELAQVVPINSMHLSELRLQEESYTMSGDRGDKINSGNMNNGNINSDKTKVQSIGEAWLEKDGGITLSLRSDAYGDPISAMFTYKTNDRDYAKILKHLGGLKPGEVKDVPPFPDKTE